MKDGGAERKGEKLNAVAGGFVMDKGSTKVQWLFLNFRAEFGGKNRPVTCLLFQIKR